MPRTLHKLRTFNIFAHSLSSLSTCKRAKVGTIIFPCDFSEILAIGYNGPPVGSHNDSCADIVGECGCVHAEVNALVKLSTPRKELVILTTKSPCIRCASLIANCKQIMIVLYCEEYRDVSGLDVLHKAGKLVVSLKRESEKACRLLRELT